jgi:hypothetical protein
MQLCYEQICIGLPASCQSICRNTDMEDSHFVGVTLCHREHSAFILKDLDS